MKIVKAEYVALLPACVVSVIILRYTVKKVSSPFIASRYERSNKK